MSAFGFVPFASAGSLAETNVEIPILDSVSLSLGRRPIILVRQPPESVQQPPEEVHPSNDTPEVSGRDAALGECSGKHPEAHPALRF
jgi:hypothetical protein